MSQLTASCVALDESGVPMLTENAVVVLRSRYLDRVDGTIIETPAQLFRRVSRHLARAEKHEEQENWADVFYKLMVSGKFMPNSPTLMNAGRRLGMLSACFVLPVPDDTGGIFKSIHDTAIIQKAGGGTGFAFDELRPCGSYVKSSGGRSSGPLSFWRVFCEATNAIQQGSFRRGANMAMMRADHPDIIKFLFSKQDLSQFTNYNISIKVTDSWMKLVRNYPDAPHVVRWENQSWLVPKKIVDVCQQVIVDAMSKKLVNDVLVQPRDLDVCYGIGDLVPTEEVFVDHDAPPVEEQISACHGKGFLTVGEVMDIIVGNAWRTGEPGLCFIDRIRETEATPNIAKIEATNPCGEQPLMPNEACNLGSINLNRFVKPFYEDFDPRTDLDMVLVRLGENGERDRRVDWDGLAETVKVSVRLLDNVVTVNNYPTPEIADTCRRNRKIGLGIMGFADALIRLGVQYDSEEGLKWGERFMKFINEKAIAASEELAAVRGSFAWHSENRRWKKPMRNACVTTIAPTGTISIIANCSGGIEPLFSFAFMRKVLNGEQLMQYHDDFRALAERWGFASDDLLDDIFKSGTVQHRKDVPDAVKRIFRSARDITPSWHVKMQGAMQKHVTSAVSKTINLPFDAEVADVRAAYLLASENGCKGVTVYRDGSRAMQPMSLKAATEKLADDVLIAPEAPSFRDPTSLSDVMLSIKTRYKSTYGTIHVNITFEITADGKYREREVFFDVGRSGELQHANTEAYGRLGSFILRLDGKIESVIHCLRSHGSVMEARNRQTGSLTSLPNELAMALLKYYEATQDVRDEEGFLSRMPDPRRKPKTVPKPLPTVHVSVDNDGGNGKVPIGSDIRTTDFVRQVLAESSRSGTFRAACPVIGCSGELAHGEGCCKCTVCGQGTC